MEAAAARERPIRGDTALRRLHSASGLWLGGFLVFHAWQQAAVRSGRDALLQRLGGRTQALWVLALLLVPLGLHAGLGLALSRRPDAGAPRAYASQAFRRFQRSTGALGALLLAAHVGGVWWPHVRSGRAAEAYGALLDQTAGALGAGLYVLGISVVCLHFGQGLSAALLRWAPRCPLRLARALGGAFGLGLWLAYFDLVAGYARGVPLM
jgi:succinate dehydrogenase/fumarate reductase cytochrome b subunit